MTKQQQGEMFDSTVENWCVGPDELAVLFSCSVSMIHKYVKNYGMPKEDRGSFNVRKCLKWFVEYMQISDDGQKGGNEDRSEARRNYLETQTERARLEIDQRKGLLIPASQVADVLNGVAAIVSTQLDGLAPRVAGTIAPMDDPAKIQEVIFDECRSIRAAIATRATEFASSLEAAPVDFGEDNQPAAEA